MFFRSKKFESIESTDDTGHCLNCCVLIGRSRLLLQDRNWRTSTIGWQMSWNKSLPVAERPPNRLGTSNQHVDGKMSSHPLGKVSLLLQRLPLTTRKYQGNTQYNFIYLLTSLWPPTPYSRGLDTHNRRPPLQKSSKVVKIIWRIFHWQ